MTTTLVLVLVAAVVVSVAIGLLARMSAKEIAGQSAAMCAVALLFWGLVVLL